MEKFRFLDAFLDIRKMSRHIVKHKIGWTKHSRMHTETAAVAAIIVINVES